jgi:hypothetical protein
MGREEGVGSLGDAAGGGVVPAFDAAAARGATSVVPPVRSAPAPRSRARRPPGDADQADHGDRRRASGSALVGLRVAVGWTLRRPRPLVGLRRQSCIVRRRGELAFAQLVDLRRRAEQGLRREMGRPRPRRWRGRRGLAALGGAFARSTVGGTSSRSNRAGGPVAAAAVHGPAAPMRPTVRSIVGNSAGLSRGAGRRSNCAFRLVPAVRTCTPTTCRLNVLWNASSCSPGNAGHRRRESARGSSGKPHRRT